MCAGYLHIHFYMCSLAINGKLLIHKQADDCSRSGMTISIKGIAYNIHLAHHVLVHVRVQNFEIWFPKK